MDDSLEPGVFDGPIVDRKTAAWVYWEPGIRGKSKLGVLLTFQERDALIAREEALRDKLQWEKDNFALKIGDLPDAEEFLAFGCDAAERLADEILLLRDQIEKLRSALERTETRFVSAVNNHPVRDMEETLAENTVALGRKDKT